MARNTRQLAHDRQVVAHRSLGPAPLVGPLVDHGVEPGREDAQEPAVLTRRHGVPGHVHAPRAAVEDALDGLRRVAHRQPQLARDVVAGAGRDDAQRHPRARAQVGPEVHHAVAPGDHDAVDRTRGDRRPALLHRTAGVGRAEVEDVDPGRAQQGQGLGADPGPGVLPGGGVDDETQARHGRRLAGPAVASCRATARGAALRGLAGPVDQVRGVQGGQARGQRAAVAGSAGELPRRRSTRSTKSPTVTAASTGWRNRSSRRTM